MNDETLGAIDDRVGPTLAAVGPRLRTLRQAAGRNSRRAGGPHRRLGQHPVPAGVRLESGRRRPTLDLLLMLAGAHQVTLDELVGAPATGDPRAHPRPVSRYGMTWLPLTRRPGGGQAYKLILPGQQEPATPPQQQIHEGYEWLYVLSGHVQLLLASTTSP